MDGREEQNKFSPSSLDVMWFDLKLGAAGIPAAHFFVLSYSTLSATNGSTRVARLAGR
jgi:hypothetical protein